MLNRRLSVALCTMALAVSAHVLSGQSLPRVTATQKQIGPLGQSITLVLMDFSVTLDPGQSGLVGLPSITLNPNQSASLRVAGYLSYQDASVSQVSSVGIGFACPGVSSPNNDITLTQSGQFAIRTSQAIEDETAMSNTTTQPITISCNLKVNHQSATGAAPILFGISPGTSAVRVSVTIVTN